ncbi:MAG: HEAT repeat domain-containing protein [Archangiaceae bacterium]|nr:HEAT repeat domain-containing protein [Archangiaceae bacterium]
MKRLALAALLSAAPAWAQVDAGVIKVPAAPRAAKAAVQKGLGSAKEDDDEPAFKPSPKGAADADAAVLRAILFAFEPAPTEIRVIAIEDLGILGDARVLNPLANLVMDPNPVVQAAALRAIGSIQHPRAEAILANIVRHPSLNERVKASAIDALLFQNTPSAVAFLAFLTRTTQIHPMLQQQARRVLQELPPGRSSL